MHVCVCVCACIFLLQQISGVKIQFKLAKREVGTKRIQLHRIAQFDFNVARHE